MCTFLFSEYIHSKQKTKQKTHQVNVYESFSSCLFCTWDFFSITQRRMIVQFSACGINDTIRHLFHANRSCSYRSRLFTLYHSNRTKSTHATIQISQTVYCSVHTFEKINTLIVSSGFFFFLSRTFYASKESF